MSPLSFSRSLVLLCLLLSACATTRSAEPAEELESTDAVYSWEEARADPSCVVPLCDTRRCAIWRCQDVVESHARPVRLAQLVIPEVEQETELRLPWEDNPGRWWGHPLAAPSGTEPVFEIPWHNWKAQERLAFKEYRSYCFPRPREPYEKHHIFPQQPLLAKWFKSRKIDIHAYTIRVPKSFHAWLHSGGPEGGQWNEAWRQFMEQNRDTANDTDIWRFAGELMSRFGVNGPFVPYYCD